MLMCLCAAGVGELGAGWVLPVAHCFAMLLFLQQRDGNAPQTAALCHRLLEMIATQPARAADMEVAAKSRQCTHGFAAGECTHPACEAAFEATNPTRGRRSGHAAQLRSSTTSKASKQAH